LLSQACRLQRHQHRAVELRVAMTVVSGQIAYRRPDVP
jgi:hypothetical protein